MGFIMNANEVVNQILADRKFIPHVQVGSAFAPSNIALVKYWGKRDLNLNLPSAGSLSVSLRDRGALTKVTLLDGDADVDKIIVNDLHLPNNSQFSLRLSQFLNYFRTDKNFQFEVNTSINLPIAAGLASSAAGFCAIVKALDHYFNWQLSLKEQSILARLGSGSASRSIANGFVEWKRGENTDGMDSYAQQLDQQWPGLMIGLIINSRERKLFSSTEAMKMTLETSPFYPAWPGLVNLDLTRIKKAIEAKEFTLLGSIVEGSATAMHALIMSSRPSITYTNSETLKTIKKVWQLREEGLPIYFTQDAGPNIKLLFERNNLHAIKSNFPSVEVVDLFESIG